MGGWNIYWEKETPLVVKSGRVMLKHYPGAGKLQILAYFTRGGEEIITKNVALDREDLRGHPDFVRAMMEILAEWCRDGG